MDWNKEKIDELISLFNDGITYQQIAFKFDVSKNTIVGKLNRLNLKRKEIKVISTFDERMSRLESLL